MPPGKAPGRLPRALGKTRFLTTVQMGSMLGLLGGYGKVGTAWSGQATASGPRKERFQGARRLSGRDGGRQSAAGRPLLPDQHDHGSELVANPGLPRKTGRSLLCTEPDKNGVFQSVKPYCEQGQGLAWHACWVNDALLLGRQLGPQGERACIAVETPSTPTRSTR